MKLYVTMTSPYGRLARIVVLEKKLEGQVEIVEAQTRTRGSPFYQINPSGRVPCLLRDDGVIMEDSQLICAWLDSHDGNPRLTRVLKRQDWVYGRLESYARSMLDGVAVWVREMRRPEGERSPITLQHEVDRCVRMADFWEREIGDAVMRDPLNMAQMLLISGIELAEHRKMTEVLPRGEAGSLGAPGAGYPVDQGNAASVMRVAQPTRPVASTSAQSARPLAMATAAAFSQS